MQEKDCPVFIIATANSIHFFVEKFPEFLRKTRFDNIFFVDLPKPLERKAIRDAIRSTDMMTVCGPVKFDEKGLPVNKVLVNIQYMDGKARMVYANASGKKFPEEVPITPFQYQTKWSDRK